MPTDLDDPFPTYPMVDGGETAGDAAGVYAALLLAREGGLQMRPALGVATSTGAVEPQRPQVWERDAPVPRGFDENRAAVQAPVVNALWRGLAGTGVLEAAWGDAGSRGRRPARRGAGPGRGATDVRAPRIDTVLDAYVATVPGVLVVVPSSLA